MGRQKRCKVCNKVRTHLTRKRRCLGCSMNRNIAVVKQLRAKKGKHYKKWKRNLLAALKKI